MSLLSQFSTIGTYTLLSANVVYTAGASAASQAISFAICFAMGLAIGIVALLYLRKAGKAERALTDLFATLTIGGICLLSMEYATGGKPEAYAFFALTLGAFCSFFTIKRLKNRKK